MRTLDVIDWRTAASACLLLVALVWHWFFHHWLRHRPRLLEQGTQDLVLLASCGGLLFVLAGFLLVVLPGLNEWLVAAPLAAWLALVAAYLARRPW